MIKIIKGAIFAITILLSLLIGAKFAEPIRNITNLNSKKEKVESSNSNKISNKQILETTEKDTEKSAIKTEGENEEFNVIQEDLTQKDIDLQNEYDEEIQERLNTEGENMPEEIEDKILELERQLNNTKGNIKIESKVIETEEMQKMNKELNKIEDLNKNNI